jgi:hypothetical protein
MAADFRRARRENPISDILGVLILGSLRGTALNPKSRFSKEHAAQAPNLVGLLRLIFRRRAALLSAQD